MAQTNNKKIVLIVDDDAAMLRSVRNLLRSAGHEALAYQMPNEFLETADFGSASCIVLDVSMPLLDGFEVFAELSKRGVGLPVILMSGVPSDEARARASAAGIFAYFSKPFDEEEFLAAIDDAATDRGVPQHD
ncbi:response regulator transcription factor [Sinorhizobium medicae]|uniref:Response regulator n=1 Tax=Sinorhizobium medicae TaxID=110321 RepID=A0A508XAZ5_9HYPH|nr:response regulator [Sinorhizobium medicae]VTZ65443.1 Response regulator [Sinorhizobium medicae]